MQIGIIQTGTVEYDKMADLRMKVLLGPIGIPRTYIDPLKEKDDILVGAFENDRLIGCCILTHVDDQTLQLRQMAVDQEIQGRGIGAAIIAFAENLAMERGYKAMMMHARDTVLGFYEKCGYTINGEPFFEVGIGHHRMEKRLA